MFLLSLVACEERPSPEDERAAIRAAWDRGVQALESGDWETYRDFWAHVGYAQVIHPDQGEWLVGWDSIGPSYREFLADEQRLEARTRNMRIRVAPSGDMAWATLEADLDFASEEDTATITLWETVVFEKVASEWKLVHGHVSQPDVR